MFEFLLENDFISALLAFALVLIPAIIFHELGHFFAAKIIGVNVLEFGIGLPPRMARLFMWGETEFTLNWIPLGGFVRPLGEDMIGPTMDDEDDKLKNDYISERDELRMRGISDEKMLSVNEAKPLPRIFFMVAGPFANFITAIFFFIIVALIGLPQVIGARTQIIDVPTSSSLYGLVENGDAIELINGEYFQTLPDFFEKMKETPRPELTLRSLETNERYTLVYETPIGSYQSVIFVTAVDTTSPAYEAGMEPGDYIIAVDGLPFDNASLPAEQIVNIATTSAGTPISLTILRGDETFDIMLTPRLNPPPNAGRIGIGIENHYNASDGIIYGWATPQDELIPQSLSTAVTYGFSRFFEILTLIIDIPNQLISGAISPEEARPVSIVGISQVGGQFLQQSIRDNTPGLILDFLALISIFLGVTNLLPLPPLDGGRVLFVLIEMVRGKPMSPTIEYNIYRFGMIFLLSLGVLIIFYDILNPFVLPT